MRVASLRWRFTAERVRETPDLQGVYTLWDGKECVYVGHTPWNRSLQQCLRAHLALSDEGAIRASHFTWETTSTPKSREQEVLERRVEKAQGRLPRYNLPNSPLAPTKTSVTDLHARS
jgi:hypothetical protein